MFCIKCGTNLPDEALFCSNCGNKTGSSGEAKNESSQNETFTNVGSEIQKKSFHEFNLLGHNVQIDQRIDLYNSIRKVFSDKALHAVSTVEQLYMNKYTNIDKFINHADDDVDDLFVDALESGLEILHKNGAYNINSDLLSNHIYQHIGDWEEIYEAICDEVDDIREAETGEKNYRRARKNGRGRIIGGGFGVEGAIKGIATAGAVNAASGLMHSFGNAIGNASSSANARKQEREILKNPEFLPTIKKTVYNDILGMHVGVIELYNKSFNMDIPLDYPTENYQEALIILQNVNQGVVHESNMNKAMVDAIVKWPYDYQFYNFILSKDDSSIEELERYAHYFNTDITNIRLSKEKALAQKKKIETQFGQYANEFMTNLSDNYYFNSLVDILSTNPIENLTEAYKMNKFSCKDNKLYILLFDEGEKAKKCVQVASSTYAQLSPNEVPIIAFDNTSFSGGKEGFLITDQKIHVKVSFEKPFSIAFKDIQTIATDSKSNLLINNNKVDFLLMRGKDKSIIGEFITFVLYSFKYSSGTIEMSVSDVAKVDTIAIEAPKAQEEARGKSDFNNIESVMNIISSSHNEIKDKLFILSTNEKTQEKFKNARFAYAFIHEEEKPIALFDNTAFGSAKDGFLITDRNIYYHNMWSKPGKISLASVQTIQIKGSGLLVNDIDIQINLIVKKYRNEFCQMMNSIVNLLK